MGPAAASLLVYTTCGIWVIGDLSLILHDRRRSDASTDRGSLRLVLLAVLAAAAIGYAASYLHVMRLPGSRASQMLVGTGLMWVGMLFRWWAILTLGRFFSAVVSIKRDHQLIRSGPYAHLRHPAYTGSLVSFLGLGVALGSWVAVVSMPIVLFLGFRSRMTREEEALIDTFGQHYRDYIRETKRLIPGIY